MRSMRRPISLPVLHLRCNADPYVLADPVYRTQRYAPHGRYVSISGAGHYSHEEQPDEVNGHLSRFLDAIVTVTEDEIAAAVRLAAEESRLVAEPSGALSVAALAFRADDAGLRSLDGPIVAVVSGGNVDPYSAYAAQSAEVLLSAIEKSDGTRASVASNLLKTNVTDGILGSFKINSNGDTNANPVTIYRIKNGKQTTYKTITPSTDLVKSS